MDLNIRNVDPDLIRSLKLAAVEKSLTLREYCLEKLGGIRIVKLTKTGDSSNARSQSPKRDGMLERTLTTESVMQARSQHDERRLATPTKPEPSPSYYVPAKYRKVKP
jgi:hypothetical protein